MNVDETIIAYHIAVKSNDISTTECLDRLRGMRFETQELTDLYAVFEDCRIKGDVDPLDAYQQLGKEPVVLYEYFNEIGISILEVSNLSMAVDRILNKQFAKKILDLSGDLRKGIMAPAEFATLIHEEIKQDTSEILTYREITHAMEGREHKPGLRIGFNLLDYVLDGLQPGTFSILAARPGVGKTDFALAISRNLLDHFKNIYLASLEMSRWAIHKRNERYGRNWSPKGTFFIDDRPSGTTVAQIITSVMCRKVDLVIVDYLQLLGYRGRVSGLYEKTTELSHQLMAAAKNTQIPWLVLSQLSRKAADETQRPKLSDLRDSGAIEQDANAVMFMYAPEKSNDNGDGKSSRYITIAVAKNREAGIGDIRFKFMPSCGQWEENE